MTWGHHHFCDFYRRECDHHFCDFYRRGCGQMNLCEEEQLLDYFLMLSMDALRGRAARKTSEGTITMKNPKNLEKSWKISKNPENLKYSQILHDFIYPTPCKKSNLTRSEVLYRHLLIFYNPFRTVAIIVGSPLVLRSLKMAGVNWLKTLFKQMRYSKIFLT